MCGSDRIESPPRQLHSQPHHERKCVRAGSCRLRPRWGGGRVSASRTTWWPATVMGRQRGRERGRFVGALEAGRDGGDLGRGVGDAGELVDVLAQQPLAGPTRPPGEPIQPAALQRGNFGVNAQRPPELLPLGQSEADRPLEGALEATVLGRTATESREWASSSTPMRAGSPPSTAPAGPHEGQATRAEHRPPALLDVGVGQVEAAPTHPRIRWGWSPIRGPRGSP